MKERKSIWLLSVTLLSALLALSCVKTQETEPDDGWTPLTGDVPVSFSSAISTKATSPLPANTTFGVFGYYTGTSNWGNNTIPNFMFDEDVHYDGSTYTYSPIKYWPNQTSDKLTFWAYSPYGSYDALVRKSGNNYPDYTNENRGLPDIRFTTDGDTDFMTSDIRKNQSCRNGVNPDATVHFTFKHCLSKIAFYLKKYEDKAPSDPEKYTVQVKSIRLEGIELTGIRRTSLNPPAWVMSGNRGNITSYADGPLDNTDDIILGLDYPAAGSPDAVSYVLPQDLDYAYARLHIEYTIDFDEIVTPRTMISNIPLKTVFDNVSALWVEATEYNVYIRITPDDPIEFSVAWSDWGTYHNIEL